MALLTASLALLLAASGARAETVASPALQGLQDAMVQRVAEIDALPSPSSAEKKEGASLIKALVKLGQYAGVDDKPDLKRLASCASLLFKSKSADAGVLAGVAALHDEIDTKAALARQDALNLVGVLNDPKHVAKVDKLVAKGDAQRGDGLVKWPVNYGKGAKKLNAATLTFRKALATVLKKQLAEAKKSPNDARITDSAVETIDPQIYHAFRVLADLALDQPVTELTLALRAARKDQVDAGVDEISQVTIGETTFFDLPAGSSPIALEYQMPIVRDESFDKLTAPAPSNFMQFGRSLATSGTTIVVGSGNLAGGAAVLARDQGGLGAWGQVAELVSSDFDPGSPNSGDDFGFALAISGDTIVVGAPKLDLPSGFGTMEEAGAAYVFERDAGGPGAWGQVARLVATLPDPLCGLGGDFAHFGRSVAISGDTIAVGAPGAGYCDGSDKAAAGDVYLFERDAGGPDAWGQVERLRAWDGDAQDQFGYSVALSGTRLAVGALNGDHQTTNGGTVYYFKKNASPQVGWTSSYVTRLSAGEPFGKPGDGFGTALAFVGDTLAVGAPRSDVSGKADAGAVYLFDTATLSEDCEFFEVCTWMARLTADDAAADDFFGNDVAVTVTPVGREVVVVGAPRGDYGGIEDAGAAYLFDRDLGGPGNYGQLIKVITNGEDAEFTADHLDSYGSPDPSDPYKLYGPNTFGAAVAAEGEQLVIGAPLANQSEAVDAGAIWVFGGIEPVLSGDYYVAVDVDPHDRLLETAGEDAEDNIFPLADPVTFHDEEINTPNVAIVSAGLDPDVIFWDVTEGVQAAILGMNATVAMTGKHDAPLSGVGCRVRAKIADQSTFQQATLWDPVGKVYVTELKLSPLFADEPRGLHLDIKLPPPPGGLLPNADGYPATLEVSLVPYVSQYDPDDPGSPATDDDTLTTETMNYMVVALPDCTYSEDYEKSLGNSVMGATVRFETSLDLTHNLATNPVHVLFPDSKATAGAVAGVEGGVDVLVLGHDLDLVQFRALAERDPIQHYGFFGADLLFRNPITGDYQVVYSVGPYDTDDLDDPNLTFPDGFEVCDGSNGCEGGIKFTKELSFEKNTNDPKGKKQSKTFYPGGVPVTVEGIVEGKLGFELEMIAADGFSLQGKPFADLSAGVDLAIGDCSVLCVGAGGELTLVKDEFKAKGAVGMNVESGQLDGEDYTNMAAAMCFHVANEVTLLDGKLFVFAKYPWFKWCKTFLGKIPCGFEIKTSKYDIIDWTAFVYCSQIASKVKPLCCEPVIGTNPSCASGLANTDCAFENCPN